MTVTPNFKAGLENVVAGTSELCLIDGRRGRLLYCGYDVVDLAEQSSFEEVIFLLHYRRLPTRSELAELEERLRSYRAVPAEVLDMLGRLPRTIHPMAALRTGLSLLGNFDPEAETAGPGAYLETALRLTAQMATLVAAWEQLRNGRQPLLPHPGLSHAANFLYMLRGTEPEPFQAQVFDVALILHADHELNASTFAARVTAASLTDLYSAVVAALGTLKGPLHGGANELIMRMLREIGDPAAAQRWVAEALARRQRIPGFGHRVYKTKDPRAQILERHAAEAGRRAGETRWVELARALERAVGEQKGLYPNVDLYSGPVYAALGIPTDLFTPVFAVSRIAGWTAHIREQIAHNRMIRPRAEYVGPERLPYLPLNNR